MPTEFSDRALIQAVTSVFADIVRTRKALAAPDVTDEQVENEGELLLEMERAYRELAAAYRERQSQNASLPRLEDIEEGILGPETGPHREF